MKRASGFAMFVVALGYAAAAHAHAHLKSAVPPVNGSVSAPPTDLVIEFTEAVEPRFSTIEVRDATDRRVDAGEPHTGSDGKHLAVPLRPLPVGTYKVIWHATSVDTHKTDGTYEFRVTP